MTSQAHGATALTRLHWLGYTLPPQNPGKEKYAPCQWVGAGFHVSGQLPYVDGKLPAQGILGRDVGMEQAEELARLAALNALAVAASAVGDLERLRVVQMMVFVASTPEFGEQWKVADAASALLLDVLGDNGQHARTAIGVAGLPSNSPVEIQMVCTTVPADG
ncbi:RidA family protein [Streptomyces sp. NPDC050433]|uniref:RidA family protein n=1 Tax=Streptomyces sp. NPDC050433 TaxID=3365615 RepID=UPI0037BA0757